MYHVYIKTSSGFDSRKLIGEFGDYEEAQDALDAELAKDSNTKYVIEEATGAVDSYGNLIIDVVDEN